MKKKLLGLFLAGLMTTNTVFAANISTEARTIAFPGAEGGGKYVTGGRGCEVYTVTTLDDYTSDEEPIFGSFRDAVSQDNRTIVFNVSGTIELKERLLITNRKNITIAGQTAPGNGITLYGFETNLSNSENIIIRYIRFRPGAKNVHTGDSMDALWGRSMKDIIIDHISTSWSTDETMSLYRAENMTVQWSIIAESLTMSGHTKGRHGYGAIWGGVNTTYHHNLIANHTSRNPRMGGGTVEADDNEHIATFDMRNNVIYNWGFNTIYGGGRSKANFINNYQKAGQGTRESVSNRLIDAGEKDKPGWFYVNGNYMAGNKDITNDNKLGIYISEDAKPTTTIVDKEFKMEGTKPENLRTTTAEKAYKEVLAKAGATLPKRDALDARIINEVKTDTGRYVNKDSEVGGYPVTTMQKRSPSFDKDKDGIPDTWEIKNNLNPKNPNDSKELSNDNSGYTNLERYINSIVDMEFEPENPEIEIISPKMNEIIEADKNYTIEAKVSDNDGISKVIFYNGSDIIGTKTNAPYKMDVNLSDGTYHISAKAIDTIGNETQATASIIHVNNYNKPLSWTSIDIGTPKITGNTSENEDGSITLKGSGKLASNSDMCHFSYKQLKGDVEISTKINSITAIDNHAFGGLMIRESLEPTSKSIGLGLSYTKAYSWKEEDAKTGKTTTLYRNPWSIYLAGRNDTNGNFDELGENLDSPEVAAETGISLQNDIPFKDLDTELGYYVKIARKGNKFIAYTSVDGNNWNKLGTRTIDMNETIYVGFAVDGNKVDNQLDNLNTVKFSDIKINQ